MPQPTEQFSKRFFWDLDPEKLDYRENKNLIIERILNLGDIVDYIALVGIYGKEEVINTAMNNAILDKKTLNWLSLISGRPKTDFRCYSKIQSKKVHWKF